MTTVTTTTTGSPARPPFSPSQCGVFLMMWTSEEQGGRGGGGKERERKRTRERETERERDISGREGGMCTQTQTQ